MTSYSKPLCVIRLLTATLFISSCCYAQSTFIDLNATDSDAFTGFALNKKVIVVGEIHGTKEVPLFVLSMLEQLKKNKKPLTLAIEVNSDYQGEFDNYVRTGDFSKILSLENFTYPDGRSSEAMRKLIEGARHLGVKLVCFDIAINTDAKLNRDSLMGVNLAHAFDGNQMVVITGNLHANLQEGYWRPNFRSAIYYLNSLSKLNDSLVSLNTYFGGGTTWCCMADGCKEHDAGKMNVGNKHGFTNFIALYEGAHPSGYTGYVYFDSVTASPPIVRNATE